ncbi:retinol-binding protein 2-like isoform X1 [Conger conger]|uniref:retinol-binding protein 2-like isoform X1 n=1 Tax=Conger conger TaxID=82655 RepID=UPI002A5A3B93|nr:retinol-binding protein 2-like isoform X1 [Conger conger]
MPADFNGTWEMESNDNLEDYLKALNIDFATRKIAVHLSPSKVFIQNHDVIEIKTLSHLRTHEVKFTVGKDFEYKGVDNRVVQALVTWEGDKLACVQKGEKANRGWKYWVEDNKLHLEMTCEGQTCHQVFRKNK